jgi:hypothetical protein
MLPAEISYQIQNHSYKVTHFLTSENISIFITSETISSKRLMRSMLLLFLRGGIAQGVSYSATISDLFFILISAQLISDSSTTGLWHVQAETPSNEAGETWQNSRTLLAKFLLFLLLRVPAGNCQGALADESQRIRLRRGCTIDNGRSAWGTLYTTVTVTSDQYTCLYERRHVSDLQIYLQAVG